MKRKLGSWEVLGGPKEFPDWEALELLYGELTRKEQTVLPALGFKEESLASQLARPLHMGPARPSLRRRHEST